MITDSGVTAGVDDNVGFDAEVHDDDLWSGDVISW